MKAASLVLCVLGLFGVGCSTVSRTLAEWKPLPRYGQVWSAPGELAVLESRSYYKIMTDGGGDDIRWRAPNGRTVDAWRVSERLVDHLAKTGELAKWPETQWSYGGVVRRLGPYKLFLVSVFPAVAILVPYDYGSLRNRSTYDLVSTGDGGFGNPRVLNYLYTETAFAGNLPFYWMSADLGVPLTPVTLDPKGGFRVQHAKVELQGRRVEDRWEVTRTR